MVQVKENELMENGELRNSLIERVEVLDKVKTLILEDSDVMLMKDVAEYYEANYEAVKKLVQRNKDELTSNGMKFLNYNNLKELFAGDGLSLPKLSTKGSNVFSKRAVLNIGMLLEESPIAKEVRNQLLNGFEKLSNDEKVSDIEYEDSLLLNIIKASGDVVQQMIAVGEYNNFKNRHIAKLNVDIERMKPKEESFDKFMNAEGYKNIEQVGKLLGKGRNTMYKYLRDIKLLKSDNIPYQQYIDSGYFAVKENTINKNGFNKLHTQTYVTPKGITYIEKKMKDEVIK